MHGRQSNTTRSFKSRKPLHACLLLRRIYLTWLAARLIRFLPLKKLWWSQLIICDIGNPPLSDAQYGKQLHQSHHQLHSSLRRIRPWKLGDELRKSVSKIGLASSNQRSWWISKLQLLLPSKYERLKLGWLICRWAWSWPSDNLTLCSLGSRPTRWMAWIRD